VVRYRTVTEIYISYSFLELSVVLPTIHGTTVDRIYNQISAQ